MTNDEVESEILKAMLSEAALERWKGFNEARFAVALLGSRKCPG